MKRYLTDELKKAQEKLESEGCGIFANQQYLLGKIHAVKDALWMLGIINKMEGSN